MARRFGEGYRVLVVDDEASILEVLRTFLEDLGFRVNLALSFAQGREMIASTPFDLLIVDKNLPDGSGLDLAQGVIQDGMDARIVIITGYPSVESAVRAMELDVADYLTKPFELDTAERRLRRAVEALELSRENARLLTELKETNALLEGLVVKDPTTLLYNHRYFHEFLDAEIQRSARSQRECGLVLIDVDGFEEINNEHGHTVGDALLKCVADILNNEQHHEGTIDPVVARYGGDEFAMVLTDCDKHSAAATAERLRAAVEGHDFASANLPRVTLSLGVATYPDDGEDRKTVIRGAETALFAAQHAGANRMISFGPELARSGLQPDRSVEAEVRRFLALEASIANESFQFAYQPIVRGEDLAILAYEALCRPQDKEHFPSPDVLLSTAERAGRIPELGSVLRSVAVRPLADLPEEQLLFVNVHPRELSSALNEWVDECGAYAHRIVLEITEAAAIESFDQVSGLMDSLRSQGVRFALDDVGAGYMGLGALVRLAPSFIKLDMSLLRGIVASSREAALIQHIMSFADSEGIEVIAEGIETESELRVVKQLGCRVMQGYYFARPAPAFCSLNAELSR